MLLMCGCNQLQSGEARIVGDDGCDAVLCTADKTYEIKKVETSNAVCLVPTVARDAPAAYCIEAIKNDFFEVSSTVLTIPFHALMVPTAETDRGEAGEAEILVEGVRVSVTPSTYTSPLYLPWLVASASYSEARPRKLRSRRRPCCPSVTWRSACRPAPPSCRTL